MIQILFWLSVIAIVYPYVIYPLCIGLWSFLFPKNIDRGPYEPKVTVLIAAHNEINDIEKTVQNKLEQDYPKEKLQIIVISDGSEDGTDEVVKKYAPDGVILIRQEPRQGKAAGLNIGVTRANGEILVFSDANSLFGKDAITNFVKNFRDPKVGYVTGKLGFTQEDGSVSGDGCGAYMRYENWLRAIETRFGSVIGVNGGVDAIRSNLYRDIPADLITDFVLPLSVVADNYRVIFDENVRSFEAPNQDIKSEFRMRTRVALRALQGIIYMRRLVNPFRYPKASFSLTSHKILRYIAPLFMVGALTSNIFLAINSNFYSVLLIMQLTLYAIGFLGMAFNLPGKLKSVVTLPSYLLMTNIAFAVAIFKLFKGEKMAVWKPRAG